MFCHDKAELFKPSKDGSRTYKSMEVFYYQQGTPNAIQPSYPKVWRYCSVTRQIFLITFKDDMMNLLKPVLEGPLQQTSWEFITPTVGGRHHYK